MTMLNRTWRALAAICPITILCLASREPAPEYRTIPAAATEEMTPAAAPVEREAQRDWVRAHADNESSGYSGLRQITRDNVRKL
jgi:glucose dehydrogenase